MGSVGLERLQALHAGGAGSAHLDVGK
jgi:hypothetical protein